MPGRPTPSLADPACLARVVEEIAIVQPKIVVVMGEEALAALNDLDAAARPDGRGRARRGAARSRRRSTRSCVPNIDDALDDEDAKRAFWAAFRALGAWWSDFPPY